MNAFVAIAVFVLIAYFISNSLDNDSEINFFKFAVAVLIIFSALRYPFDYADQLNYASFFYKGYLYDDWATGENFNVGYSILNKLVHSISPSFQLLEVVISLFVVMGHAFFIKKYSPSIMLSLFIYVLVAYFWSLVTVRQYLAITVSLFSYIYVIERRLVPFLLTSIISIAFHTSAVIFFPVYFIYGLRETANTKYILFFGALFAILLFKIFSTYLVGNDAYYSTYLISEESSSWQRLIMKAYILILFIIVMGEEVYTKNINFLLLICFIFNIIIYVGGNGIYGVFRIREYFDICEFIGIPIMFCKTRESNNQIVLNLAICIYLALLVLSCYNTINMSAFPVEYKFYWDGVPVNF